jgi:signal transduction histidine kinase
VHARFRARATAVEHLAAGDGGRRTVVITSAGPPAVGGEGDGAEEEARQFQVIRDETAAESARRMRDAILANVSHEFRTPLAAQLASLELLREQLPDLETEQVRDLLFSIERSTVRLTQLIDNLLESVRIDAGQDSIRRQRVALDEVVEEAADLAAPLLALQEQELAIELPRPAPAVSGDRARLVQVFVNLLANANKFAPQASTIRVGARTEGDQVAIWVEDEGPGIPPEEAEMVFERFRRSAGEEPAETGMGLGLWIVRSIVERHGGSVEAAAGARGARLVVHLPIDAAAAGARA